MSKKQYRNLLVALSSLFALQAKSDLKDVDLERLEQLKGKTLEVMVNEEVISDWHQIDKNRLENLTGFSISDVEFLVVKNMVESILDGKLEIVEKDGMYIATQEYHGDM